MFPLQTVILALSLSRVYDAESQDGRAALAAGPAERPQDERPTRQLLTAGYHEGASSRGGEGGQGLSFNTQPPEPPHRPPDPATTSGRPESPSGGHERPGFSAGGGDSWSGPTLGRRGRRAALTPLCTIPRQDPAPAARSPPFPPT